MLFLPTLHGPKIHSFFIGIAEVKSLGEVSHMALETDNPTPLVLFTISELLFSFSLFYVLALQTDFSVTGCTVAPVGGNN